MRFSFFGRLFEFKTTVLPTLFTSGVTNRTADGMYVLFADYDNCNLKVVEEDAVWLQDNWEIGDLLILSSSSTSNEYGEPYGNYHLIGFTKFRFPEILKILEQIRCDRHFIRGWKYQNRSWVLRTGMKKNIKDKTIVKEMPKYVSIFTSKSPRVYSTAHAMFFEKMHNINIPRSKRVFDGITKLEGINYVTR